MQLEELVAHCLAKPGAEETHAWGDGELVAKVGGKAFAVIGLESRSVGVKCRREAAEAAVAALSKSRRPGPPGPGTHSTP